MSVKTKLKIGEFSELMQVTIKILQHYEQKGLLLLDEGGRMDEMPLLW